jgi:hypothetical protein
MICLFPKDMESRSFTNSTRHLRQTVQKGTGHGSAGIAFLFKKVDGVNLPREEVAPNDKLVKALGIRNPSNTAGGSRLGSPEH